MISALNIQQGWRMSPFWRLMVALWLVYIVWGTTYFAIGVAVHSFPPLWMNATRFTLAGVIMLAWALWRGEKLPSWRQWRNAALVGGLMVFLAMNFIGFAQKLGIGSGLMATVVTTMPMWLALWTRLGGERACCRPERGRRAGIAGR